MQSEKKSFRKHRQTPYSTDHKSTRRRTHGATAVDAQASKQKLLRQALMPTLVALFRQDPESLPFRLPVDPQILGIPDYFEVVKKPMDLSTIWRKLNTGQYQDPWQYIEDVWLIFNNAWLYNKKTSPVYHYCSKLAAVFEKEIDPVMKSLGYCCGRKLTFYPSAITCDGRDFCQIQRDTIYFSYKNRFNICERCFNAFQGNSIPLRHDISMPWITKMKKNKFQPMRNDNYVPEMFVSCIDCSRKMHQICVLHHHTVSLSGFTCDNCLKKSNRRRQENKFMAKRLPQTVLGNYLENRVNDLLRQQNQPGAGKVTIRVVHAANKMVHVQPSMASRFVDNGEMPDCFPYVSKALFAFQELDGADVCFFGMHVQEYGSNCPPPNNRKVYIASLDSVHFFQPQNLRTAVYHEILLGYLDYVKRRGFTAAHIWSCPPRDGQDYIFHRRPADQKIPDPERLRNWYKKMLDKGVAEGIVHNYKDIFQHAVDSSLTSVTQLPYFNGDVWPLDLEECVQEQEEDEGENLTQLLYTRMEQNEDYFVIRLNEELTANTQRPIMDPDPPINFNLMDSYGPFLKLARDKNLEFSSLRRAKWSTMCMLLELHYWYIS